GPPEKIEGVHRPIGSAIMNFNCSPKCTKNWILVGVRDSPYYLFLLKIKLLSCIFINPSKASWAAADTSLLTPIISIPAEPVLMYLIPKQEHVRKECVVFL